jgi:hypothetical protein
MKIKVYEGSSNTTRLEEYTTYMNDPLPYFFRGRIPGFIRTDFTCREVLYKYTEKIMTLKDVFKKEFTFGFRIKLLDKRERILQENFIENTAFNGVYFLDSEDYVCSSYLLNPASVSLLALIFREYVEENPEDIPMAILKSIINGKRDLFRKEYLFTAFFSHLILNPEFKEISEYIITQPNFGKPNGPGRFFFSNLSTTLNINNNNGYINAGDWWKNPEIKSLLKSMKLETQNNIVSKIIVDLMEE